MILLSRPLKNDSLETTVSIVFFLEIEIFTTKRINSKSLKKICRQLLSTMNILKKHNKQEKKPFYVGWTKCRYTVSADHY